MSIDAEYDRNNIFAKIIRGDAPSTKVYEDDKVLAIMDAFPQSEGHCLVLHKKSEAVNFLDVESSALSELTTATQKIANAIKSALNPAGIRVLQFNGARAGQTVFHLHFHILPVYEGVVVAAHASGKPADPAVLEPVAAKIRAALSA
ncbi:HIT family protein [Hyphococcus sp.]|uniref:HIT family protein n=1 Tax=Hyphococcus sp. TaxID=2038636 RepID=UPI00208B2D47|nr:MAG: hydrolase [Marinicaulis sp.]